MARAIFLPPQKAAAIHEATLSVLERTGVKLQHRKGAALLLEAGARKDRDGRILIPRKLVQESLEKIRPRSKIQLYDRGGRKSILVQNGRTHFGPGADALYNIDPYTRIFRRSTLQDVRVNVRLVDALAGFEFVMSMALPSDVGPGRLYPAKFAAMVENTTKPIVVTSTSIKDLQRIHRIAAMVSGSREALKQKPFLVIHLDPISPLIMDKTSVERLLYCAEHDLPILYAAGANCGSSAPVTPEGAVVQGGAESLAGLVLALLKNENARFIYGSNTSAMDMRSSIISYGDPIWHKTVAMYADLGKYYGIPSWGTAGSADAFSIDAQAAMEAYEGISFVLMAGTALAHDVGYLGHGELYDARMLVLTDMMIQRAKHTLRPVDLSARSLATDVIDEVVRKNDVYLAHPHTAAHFHDALWFPPAYIDRRRVCDIKAGELADLLSQEVRGLLESHEPEPLPPEKGVSIKRFVESIPAEPDAAPET